ncbi:hypothetical protein [Mesobacillus harenae]|uniref:hypothetical protein n=1 Tax=Mesobacillus harenae TaxID=2213203 RepID=UPI00158121B3|nr:hypothetical protein [Mesobacillus harenae]
MASNKLFDFVEEVVPTQKLTEGVDFEIISYATYDPVEFELISADKYFGIDTLAMLASRSPRSTKALGKMIAKEAARKSGRIPVHVVPTPLPDSPATSFYILKNTADISLALSLGFGTARLLNPKYGRGIMLYYFLPYEEDPEEFIEDLLEEMVRLKCYLQMAEKGAFHEPGLEEALEATGLILTPTLVSRIYAALDRSKAELHIFPNR